MGHRRDSFAVARNEFIADLPHYESALKLVCEVCRGGGNSESSNVSNATNGDCENREGLLALLEKNGVLSNLSDVFNFLYHVFSSAQFELFLVHFLDSLLDLIPKSTASGLDHHVIIKSHKIRSSDFFKKEELTRWIEETANELEGASPIAKAHFYYSKGLYTAKTTFNAPRYQRKATESFTEAEKLTRSHCASNMACKTIMHYSQISLAIQLTKARDEKKINQGKNDLKMLLKTVRETWGTHPIAMEVEKSLADVYLKEGTQKPSLSMEACRAAEQHYEAAYAMMNELDITQEQSRIRLLKNKASCMLFLHIRDTEKLKSIEKMYQEARRLICQCKPCPLKYEVWCAITVFFECSAHSKRDADTKGATMKEALKYAAEAELMLTRESIEIGKSRQNIQRNLDSIKKGEPSSTALKIFGREELRSQTETTNSASHSLELHGMFPSTGSSNSPEE